MIDLEKGMKDLRAAVELHPPRLGQHDPHLFLQVVPVIPAEVVEDDEASLEQVGPERRRLFGRYRPESWFRHVGDRIVEQLRVRQREDIRSVVAATKEGEVL